MLPERARNIAAMGTDQPAWVPSCRNTGAPPHQLGRDQWGTADGRDHVQAQHDIDTGNILLQEAFPIGEEERQV